MTTAPLDPVATAVLKSMPEYAQAEVLDVYSCVTLLMAARNDPDNMPRAMQASQMQFCNDHLIAGLAIAGGEFVKMLAEALGQSVEDVVRNTLKSRHADPTDLEMFDMILEVAATGKMPESLKDDE